MHMRYLLLIPLLITIAVAHAAGHVPCLPASRILVTDTDSVAHKGSLSLGVNYGSDVQFFGRTGPIAYPYASGDAIYNFKSGFFVYGSAVQVFGYTPIVDEEQVMYSGIRKISGET
jgi:hypothetical protein